MSTPNLPLSEQTPPQIDGQIADLLALRSGVDSEIDRAYNLIHGAIGERLQSRRVGRTTVSEWPTNDHEAERIARLAADGAIRPAGADADLPAYRQQQIRDALARLDAATAQRSELINQVAVLDAQYLLRGRWNRVYLVDNSNGHVHKHTHCRTCYDTTEYCWITDLSGASDEEVVALAGGRTCVVCFAEIRHLIEEQRPCQIETPARRATREEREAKQAAKVAKGVTPDGKPLVVRLGGIHPERIEIKTERAAELRYVELMAQPRIWSHLKEDAPEYYATADVILDALAWKRNTTADALRKTLEPKVAAKVKRERGY